jgi:post-segregation antitoxin (ccd killing protein)
MRMMEPTFDTNARKRPVNLTLNADLVDRVRDITDNLSGVVEKLLTDYLEQQRQERLSRHRISEATSAAWNTFNGEHGSIADEFSSL